ncbi:MAG TPA: RDD family protein [Acidimicrobiales bacterium]|nr:RDD family protein [Acidimicrobiales bacterium]
MAAPSGIVTPEAVVLEFETAGVGSRLVAGLIDVAVQAALLLAVLFGAGAVAATGLDAGGLGAAVFYVLVFLVTFGYPIAFESLWRGRTLGKAALGLRVVTVEGAPVRFRHAAIRSILSLIDWFSTQGVVGITSLLVTKRNQRIGDLVAGTIVLRERSAAKAPRPIQFVPPPGLEAYTATLATGAIGHEEYGSIRSFLLRAATLPMPVRIDLATRLARPLTERLRTTPPPNLPAEAFLLCVAAAYQRRMAGPSARRDGSGFSSVWAGAGSSVGWSLPSPPPEPPAAASAGGGFAPPG